MRVLLADLQQQRRGAIVPHPRPPRMNGAIEAAVAARFPGPRASAALPVERLHVGRALEKALAPLHGQSATHAVWQLLERAPFSAFDWENFVPAVEGSPRPSRG